MIRRYLPSEVEQGSEKWHELRNKLLTGTDAYAILANKGYEFILRDKQKSVFSGNYYTERGHRLEDEARIIYSDAIEKVEVFGFITNDQYPLCGYSPDGLVGCPEEGLWECKAFKNDRHVKVNKELDAHVLAQIQFGLLITELPWCDLTLYDPDMEELNDKFLVQRIFPDKDIQNKLKEKLKIFEQQKVDFASK